MSRREPIGNIEGLNAPLRRFLTLPGFRTMIVLATFLFVPIAFRLMGAQSLSLLYWLPLILLGGAELSLSIMLITTAYCILFYLLPTDLYVNGLLGTAVIAALALDAYRKLGLWVEEGTPRGDRYRGFQPYVVGGAIALTAFFATSLFFRNLSIFESAVWMTLYGLITRSLPRLAPRVRIQTSSTIILALSTICSFLLLEAGVRFLTETRETYQAHEPHEGAIFSLKRGALGRHSMHKDDQPNPNVLFRISAQGLRDEHIPVKAADEFRILLLGDSYTMGYGLHTEETYAYLLQQKLDKAFPRKKVRVINCGVGGYAPFQERIFLNERGFLHDPDLVILQLFPPNDVGNSLALTNIRLHTFDPVWNRNLLNYKKQKEAPVAAERWLVRHSRAYERLTTIMKDNGPVFSLLRNFRPIPQVSYPNLQLRTDRPFLQEVCLREWYPELEEAWKKYEEAILGIASDCKTRGVAIAVFAHSDVNSLHPEYWKSLNQRWPDTPYEMNKDVRLTAEMCIANDIPYIDVLSRILAYDLSEDIYFKHDGHFAPIGARLVADTLYDYTVPDFVSHP